MTNKKHGGEEGRPRMKSSHEKAPSPGGGSTAAGVSARTRASSSSTAERRRTTKARAAEDSTSERRPRTARRGSAQSPAAEEAHAGPPHGEGGKDTWSVASESARATATTIAVAALDKKAVGLEILDVAGKVDYADFLVVMTGRSDRHAHALAQGIEEALKKKGVRPIAIEGLPHASWVLMDFGDVVVHVFQDEARQLYDIEGLWLDARRLPVPVASGPSTAD